MSGFRRFVTRAIGVLGLGSGAVLAGGCGYLFATSHLFDAELEPEVPSLEEPPLRTEQISKLRSAGELDVLVVGDGLLAACVALDTRLRGLKVALVASEDFGSQQGPISTGLTGAGVQFFTRAYRGRDPSQLEGFKDWLNERATVVKQAPHIAQSRPVLVPCYSFREVAGKWLKFKLLDVLAFSAGSPVGGSRFVTATEAVRTYPTLSLRTTAGKKLRGALVRHEVIADEGRLALTTALTSSLFGGLVVNHASVSEIVPGGEDKEGPLRVKIVDQHDGSSFQVETLVVVNASGPSTDSIRRMVDPEADPITETRTGMATSFAPYYAPARELFIAPGSDSRDPVALLAWHGQTLGEEVVPPEQPENSVSVDPILTTVSEVLTTDVREQDVTARWKFSQAMALETQGRGNKAREVPSVAHKIENLNGNVLTVVGGPWITSRAIAEEVVDQIVQLGVPLSAEPTPCRTAPMKLLGSDRYDPSLFTFLLHNYGTMRSPKILKRSIEMDESALDADTAKRLSSTYGDQSYRPAQLASQGFGRRLMANYSTLEADVIYALQSEMATTAVDVLTRTKLAYVDPTACLVLLPHLVDLMGEQLNWSRKRKDHELTAGRQFLGTLVPSAVSFS